MLGSLKISDHQLKIVAATCGNDYAPNVPGVGINKILKKVLSIPISVSLETFIKNYLKSWDFEDEKERFLHRFKMAHNVFDQGVENAFDGGDADISSDRSGTEGKRKLAKGNLYYNCNAKGNRFTFIGPKNFEYLMDEPPSQQERKRKPPVKMLPTPKSKLSIALIL